MKRIVYGLTALSVLSLQGNGNSSDHYATTSKTYLAVPPNFQSVQPELISGFRHDRTHAREEGHQGAIQFVLFGGKSFNSDDLARYFMPFGNVFMTAGEALLTLDGSSNTDVLASDFNVITVNGTNGTSPVFESTISFSPKQSTIGFGVHYRQSFHRNEEKERGFWVSASTPLMRIRNTMGFQEQVITDGGGADPDLPFAVANMTQAFNQSVWLYSKIDTGNQAKSKTALGDIELKVGYEWLTHEPCHMETYVGLRVPTGNKGNNEYLFEPIVGYGKHFGLMWGGAAGVRIWGNENDDKKLRIEYAAHSEYQFRKEQIRSFDLKNKPWSRFLPVYVNLQQAQEAQALAATDETLATWMSTPGINVFTKPLHVTPGYLYDMNSAVVFTACTFYGEVGYNLFARVAENISLASPWVPGPALKHLEGNGLTTTVRDITGNIVLELATLNDPEAFGNNIQPIPVVNYSQAIIQEADLDLASASTPAILTQTVYGVLGYVNDDRKFPLFFDVGVAATFSKSSNAIVERWTLWGKLGVSF
ncbi:MAG TPA: hypothetical protein VEK38_00235 [Candidatus Bathyarchaeia archaeon]|nr:hypothetical protein [Candidatus Bathyarchaeia archaeon]